MLTPEVISSKRFDKQMSGYRQEEVESFLNQVASDYGSLISEKEELERKIEVLAEKIEQYREDEDSLRSALIGAQKLGDSVIRDSKAKADYIIREAKVKSDRMLENAQKSIEKEHGALVKMQKEVTKFKNRLLTLYKQHLEMISALPDDDQDEEYSFDTENIVREERADPTYNLHQEEAPQQSQQELPAAERAEEPAPSQQDEELEYQEDSFHQGKEENPFRSGNEGGGMVIDFAAAMEQQDRQEAFASTTAPSQSNDSKFGPLKFGEGFDVERDNPNKNLFSRKKGR